MRRSGRNKLATNERPLGGLFLCLDSKCDVTCVPKRSHYLQILAEMPSRKFRDGPPVSCSLVVLVLGPSHFLPCGWGHLLTPKKVKDSRLI
jgi:hypothetical protein